MISLVRRYRIDMWADGEVLIRPREQAVAQLADGTRALPVYSTDTEEQARDLITLMCKKGYEVSTTGSGFYVPGVDGQFDAPKKAGLRFYVGERILEGLVKADEAEQELARVGA